MAGTATACRLRVAGTVAALLLPLAGLALLLVQPELDVRWEHHPAHFWLVLLSALLAALIAYATGEAAARRGDARVLYVSLAFLSAAGFLGLHALVTPGVLLASKNTGFAVATPVGLALGSLFAVRSTADLAGERALAEVRLGKRLRLVLLGLMALWAVLSLLNLPPFAGPVDDVERLPALLAAPAVLLYAWSAVRYAMLWRRRRSLMLVAMLSAFVLLAEAMVAIAFARNWHLTWWEWHVLMLAAFVLVAAGARLSWREERFGDLYLDETRRGERDLTVLFADLQGFTPYSEQHAPAEVAQMLDAYFAVAIPAVVDEPGGDVHQIIGDALMVTFNKRGDQPDHAQRAATAGLALQEASERVAAAHPNWPRFRVGINTGPVSLRLLGTSGGRVHAVVGDMVNTASRIEGRAPAGGVAIGPETRARLPRADTTLLGQLELKGKSEPVAVYLLRSLGPVRAR